MEEDKMASQEELQAAKENELIGNILLSFKRFQGMPDEEFETEQSRDFACREELARRGFSIKTVQDKISAVIKHAHDNPENYTDEWKFLLELDP